MIHLLITGFMCSGKTTFAKKLSLNYNLPVIDTDKYIEMETGSSVSYIINKKGIKYFRELEKKYLKKLLHSLKVKSIISAGGGLILTKENLELARKSCFNIFLNTDWGIIKQRIVMSNQKAKRPLLQNKTIEEIYQLYLSRLNLYKKYANLILNKPDINSKSLKELLLKL